MLLSVWSLPPAGGRQLSRITLGAMTRRTWWTLAISLPIAHFATLIGLVIYAYALHYDTPRGRAVEPFLEMMCLPLAWLPLHVPPLPLSVLFLGGNSILCGLAAALLLRFSLGWHLI
jgi:hypothetical protein